MEKNTKEEISSTVLNKEFFEIIKSSKKINDKTKKMNELIEFFNKSNNNIELPEIKSQIPELYSLLLINLNENNNNYVLAQMELIKAIGKSQHKEENFNNFVNQSLPKLFDKFYLGNPKINNTLIEMFNNFISLKILTIKDYYQYIENIPLEEEDNYRNNIINFLYDNINKDDTILLSNIPKSLNEIIKKLIT